MDELTSTFVNECRDQLASMEEGLLRLEQHPDDTEKIGAIFRAAHTIKGGSGVVECTFIEAFTHKVENVLDQLRNGQMRVNPDLSTVLLECCDHLGALLDVLVAGLAQPDAATQERGNTLLARLTEQTRGSAGTQAEPRATIARSTTAVPAEHTGDLESSGVGVVDTDAWHISVRFGTEVLKNGMDPLSFLRYLGTLGEITAITTVADALPAPDQMDPEACYLGFEIRFQTRASKDEIEHVFEFVRDDCTLRILPPNSKIAAYLKLIRDLPEDDMRLGEILVRSGALTQAELDEGLQRQQEPAEQREEGAVRAPIGEILVGQKSVQREVVEAAANRQAAIIEKKAVEARLIRVRAEKLDQLIDLVGEMVIAGASANLLAQRSARSELIESTSVLLRLVENIRDSALQLRMVQIGETFNRFHRVVRDAAKEIGKPLELTIRGAETELDKSVVEKIGDPLMHLIRNAMDHGIEPAAVRAAQGKPEVGQVGLNAFHDSGSIVIEVSDDGGGLPKKKIRVKAIEQGLFNANQNLSDQEITDLIFEPGFSTAEQVTSLSGRGVGMDVVRRNIQALRGSVDVYSEEGIGSRFTIRLPLTLAIIDGFLVGVDKAAYVIPLEMVVECLELPAMAVDSHYVNLRGEVLPFVRLREIFDVAGNRPARENVVVIKSGARKAGVVVDTLLGESQTVIKPMAAIFRHLRGIAGSTILGSGEVALILDVQALAQIAGQREAQRLAGRNPVPTLADSG